MLRRNDDIIIKQAPHHKEQEDDQGITWKRDTGMEKKMWIISEYKCSWWKTLGGGTRLSWMEMTEWAVSYVMFHWELQAFKNKTFKSIVFSKHFSSPDF